MIRLLHGDCLEVLPTLADASIDSVVTDPPAGISFMGRDWDHDRGGRRQWCWWMQEVAEECLRVCKPGAHALVWALPRTSHWTATAWEDAGWEVRDRVAFLHGVGFPKSMDVGKAIDKAAGVDREIVGSKFGRPGYRLGDTGTNNVYGDGIANGTAKCIVTAPATDAAKQWDGWHSALKPAVEDWWLLRKPLSEGTIAANVIRWNTGAINVGGCRIDGEFLTRDRDKSGGASMFGLGKGGGDFVPASGRWPANLCHDGSPEVLEAFAAFGDKGGGFGIRGSDASNTMYGLGKGLQRPSTGQTVGFGDSGSAARFFYSAKASREEREIGLDGLPFEIVDDGRQTSIDNPYLRGETERRCTHPTVKPLALMQWLCRLVTPPGGTILDPFLGSGSTAIAADREGFDCIGIEQSAEYLKIAHARIFGDAPLLAQIA